MYGTHLVDVGFLVGQGVVDWPVKMCLTGLGVHVIACDYIL
jgi:hypothetical protein